MHVNPVPSLAAAPAPLSQGVQADPECVVRRLNWLFRNAPATESMQQLRSIVQRYRLEAPP